MKTFKEFILEDHKSTTIDTEKLKKVLKRTSKSMTNHANGGNSASTQRGYELRARYDDAKDKLINHSHKAWLEYCKDIGYDSKHNALDHYS